jgi:hypothetical protein
MKEMSIPELPNEELPDQDLSYPQPAAATVTGKSSYKKVIKRHLKTYLCLPVYLCTHLLHLSHQNIVLCLVYYLIGLFFGFGLVIFKLWIVCTVVILKVLTVDV